MYSPLPSVTSLTLTKVSLRRGLTAWDGLIELKWEGVPCDPIDLSLCASTLRRLDIRSNAHLPRSNDLLPGSMTALTHCQLRGRPGALPTRRRGMPVKGIDAQLLPAIGPQLLHLALAIDVDWLPERAPVIAAAQWPLLRTASFELR